MNEMALESSLLDITQKLDLLTSMFQGDKAEEKKGLFAKLSSTFETEKKDKEKRRRLTQKENIYQSVPIVIDGITTDGKKQVSKLFTTTVSTPLAEKKTESSNWLKKLLAVGGFLIGAIIGVFLGLVEKIKALKVRALKLFEDIEKVFGFFAKGIRGLEKVINAVKGPFTFIAELFGKGGTLFKIWESGIYKIGEAIEKSVAFVLNLVGKIFSPLKALASVVSEKGLGFVYKFIEIFTQTGQIIGKFVKFLTTLPFIGKAIEAGITVGKEVGRLAFKFLFFLEIIYGLFQSFNDPKLQDKSGFQKIITGVVKGFLNFFDFFQILGLNLIEFNEVRDRIDKIFTAFNKDGIIAGIGQILNQIVSGILGIGGKIVGWITGWFNKSAGDLITKMSREFDLASSIGSILTNTASSIKAFFTELIPNTWNLIKESFSSGLSGFGDTISKLIDDIFKWLSSIFSLDNLKKVVKSTFGFGDNKEKPKPVADLVDDTERILFSRGESFSFDKDDQIFAMKRGGPLETMFNDRQTDIMPSDAVLKELTLVVKELNANFKEYTNVNNRINNNNIKMMGENTELLKDIRDKKSGGANVMVQNTANNTSFSDRTPSNFNYRRELSERITF